MALRESGKLFGGGCTADDWERKPAMPTLVLPQPHRLDGANAHAAHTVLLGTVESDPPLPSDQELQISAAAAETCFRTLRAAGVAPLPADVTYPWPAAAVLQAATVGLMAWIGMPGLDPSAWRRRPAGCYLLPAEREELARSALAVATRVLAYALGSEEGEGDVRARLDRFADQAVRSVPPLQTSALEAASWRRGIPWRRIAARPNVIQLGEGARQGRLDLSVTSHTARIATEIARDKQTANGLLARFGLPVARQIAATTGDAACDAARRIGTPVVVKPRRGNMGDGVSVGLAGEDEVRAAVADAQRLDTTVLVESFLSGDDHRVLVVNGRIVAATHRTPAHVVGDGEHTVRQLVERVNADPRRSKSYRTLLMPITIDVEAERLLAARGYTLETVPPSGDVVFLKSAANWTAGGMTFDRTARIHPENAELVRRAAEIVGLDVAGVDLLIPDIARSFREVGGGICEVNYKPGILVHISADGLGDRDIAGEMIELIQPDDRRGRLPTLVVCAASDGDATSTEIARRLRDGWGLRTACQTSDGLVLDGWRVADAPMPVRDAHDLAARDPGTDAAVLVADAEAVAAHGLGAAHADILVSADPAVRSALSAVAQNAGADLVASADPETAARKLVHAIDGADRARVTVS